MLKLHAVSDSAPTIDAAEVRWAAGELSALLRQMDPESPAGLVLRHAQRELGSLVRSAETARVIGSAKVKVAA